jgi:hypothetical protein
MLMLPQVLGLAENDGAQISAFCLDHAGETPEDLSHFAAVPLGQAQVVIGVHRYSLQQAIDAGKITLEGTGSFGSLRVVNHSDRAMHVEIKTPLVATPAHGESLEDVRKTANAAAAIASTSPGQHHGRRPPFTTARPSGGRPG